MLQLVGANIYIICAYYLNIFEAFLFVWKWKKVLRLFCWSHRSHSSILAKFRNTIIIIILNFTCFIVYTTSSSQFLNLCSCNHWNWSVVARLVYFNLTSQLGCAWAMFLFIWIIAANSFWQDTVKIGLPNDICLSPHFSPCSPSYNKKDTELHFQNLQFLL